MPDPRRTAVLRALIERLDGRVAIISGRTLAEVDRISEAALRSASGVHGLERRSDDGTLLVGEPAPAVRTAVAAFEQFAADRPGIIVEDKVVSAGLHFRGAQDQAFAARDLAGRLAEDTGLSLQSGNLVVELKTPGTDKGTALNAFMEEPPFRGAMPVMVGDDLTDEHGFAAATALGGFGVLVGPPRPTAARFGLKDVAAVLDWLDSMSEVPHETNP